ncbi:MAG: hypothetical protein QXS42_06580 [Zestosphaera sp.]
MSISEIEEEARRIVEEAKVKAEEILSSAKSEAEGLRSRPLVNLVTPEERRRLEEEFEARLRDLRSSAEERRARIVKAFTERRDSLVKEIVEIVTGLREI